MINTTVLAVAILTVSSGSTNSRPTQSDSDLIKTCNHSSQSSISVNRLTAQRRVISRIVYELVGCAPGSSDVICTIRIASENDTQVTLFVNLWRHNRSETPSSYAADSVGRVFRVAAALLGERVFEDYLPLPLETRLPIAIRLRIQDAASASGALQLILCPDRSDCISFQNVLGVPSSTPGASGRNANRSGAFREAAGVSIELAQCDRTDQTVACVGWIHASSGTNSCFGFRMNTRNLGFPGGSPGPHLVQSGSTSLIDARRIRIGGIDDARSLPLLSGIPLAFELTFVGLPVQVSAADLVIPFDTCQGNGGVASFAGVPFHVTSVPPMAADGRIEVQVGLFLFTLNRCSAVAGRTTCQGSIATKDIEAGIVTLYTQNSYAVDANGEQSLAEQITLNGRAETEPYAQIVPGKTVPWRCVFRTMSASKTINVVISIGRRLDRRVVFRGVRLE